MTSSSNDKLWMEIAYKLSMESKCVSRKVGCVLVKNNAIISTGVNGTPSGLENCCDRFPLYDPIDDREKHHSWSLSHELHAEATMMARIIENRTDISNSTLYVTLQPCSQCSLWIIGAGIKRVVFGDYYDKGNDDSIQQMRRTGIQVIKYGT